VHCSVQHLQPVCCAEVCAEAVQDGVCCARQCVGGVCCVVCEGQTVDTTRTEEHTDKRTHEKKASKNNDLAIIFLSACFC